MIVICSNSTPTTKFDFELVENKELIEKIESKHFDESQYFIMYNEKFYNVLGTDFYFHTNDKKTFFLGFHRSLCERYKKKLSDVNKQQSIQDFYDFVENINETSSFNKEKVPR